jgi:hypothetical protein
MIFQLSHNEWITRYVPPDITIRRALHETRKEELKLKVKFLRFEVLTEVTMKSIIFWDITPCNPLKVNWRFGGTRLHLQGLAATCYALVSFLSYSSTLQDWGNMFLRNVGWLPTDYHSVISQKIILFKRYIRIKWKEILKERKPMRRPTWRRDDNIKRDLKNKVWGYGLV